MIRRKKAPLKNSGKEHNMKRVDVSILCNACQDRIKDEEGSGYGVKICDDCLQRFKKCRQDDESGKAE